MNMFTFEIVYPGGGGSGSGLYTEIVSWFKKYQ